MKGTAPYDVDTWKKCYSLFITGPESFWAVNLNTGSFNKNYYFGYFLKEYITRLEKKHKEFAAEIDVDPTEWSQVINKHRKPTDKLILRLEIHSNKNFPALMWFKVLEEERAYELCKCLSQ